MAGITGTIEQRQRSFAVLEVVGPVAVVATSKVERQFASTVFLVGWLVGWQ
jgi:hypothetical protein